MEQLKQVLQSFDINKFEDDVTLASVLIHNLTDILIVFEVKIPTYQIPCLMSLFIKTQKACLIGKTMTSYQHYHRAFRWLY
jgi:hypothetical protein